MITETIKGLTLDVLIKKQHYENLIKRVNSVEGAISVCNELNINISDLTEDNPKSKYLKAIKELSIIIKALNEGWKPNWNDNTQYKYYNWFNMSAGTCSFSVTFYCNPYAYVPSALCFKSRKLAEYAGRTFINLYKDYYIF